MDQQHVENCLTEALKGIEVGKGYKHVLQVPPYGTQITTFAALNNAVKHCDGSFDADDPLVNRVLIKLGLGSTSNKKRELALAILNRLVPPRGADGQFATEPSLCANQ